MCPPEGSDARPISTSLDMNIAVKYLRTTPDKFLESRNCGSLWGINFKNAA